MTTCSICCETLNKSTRAPVLCPNSECNLLACRTCVRYYLLNSAEKRHCMGCKRAWDREFCIEKLTQSFITKTYNEHRKKLLFDIETAKLPATMPYVEATRSLSEKENELRMQRTLLYDLEKALRDAKTKEWELKNQIKDIQRGGLGMNVKNKEKKVFMRACPCNECNGFLSTQWKCGICDTYVCKDCHEIKGKDKDAPHTCNENSLKTAEMLKKDTKNCPSCAAAIYKISGCDQMWCTQCNVAFSWKTGLKVTGTIHNPHYYEFMKNGNGQNINNPGAVQCGGIPQLYQFRTKIKKAFGDSIKVERIQVRNYRGDLVYSDVTNIRLNTSVLNNVFEQMHRGLIHLQEVIINPMRQKCQQLTDNRDLRIKYLMKGIDKKNMMKMIGKRDKQHEKHLEQLQVYELLNTIGTERMVHCFNNCTPEGIRDCVNEVERARNYCNTQLCRISNVYKNQVKIIKESFYTESRYGYNMKKSASRVFKLSDGTDEWIKLNRYGRRF
jgi:hypothetical protein